MAALLVLPPDLAPIELIYLDGFPSIIDTIIQECLADWREGRTDDVIQCARQAQELTEAHDHNASRSVISVLLADLYRELAQPGLALVYCQKAHDALRLQPNYEHRCHVEAVIIYLQGLLHHALGANTEALSDYQQALTSFDNAIKHWNSNVVRNPMQADEYRKRADKCERVTRWINVLCRCLARSHSPVQGGMEMHIPATSGEDYALARLKLKAYLLPPEATINGQKYRLHYPANGIAFADDLKIPCDARHFVVRVPEDQWAGEHSTQGDYILAKRARKADDPEGAGLLRADDRQQWEYGEFVRAAGTGQVQFHPLRPIVIGGAPPERDVEDQDIGVVRALLKPV
jgi:tetratricopeptide (TPR) repeat protein